MRKTFTLFRVLVVAALLSTTLGGCLKDKVTKTYTIQKAILKPKAELLAAIKSNTPIEISSPGKLYTYGKYIFLNDVNTGVHVIDNSNPTSPQNIGFINIPGNVDIAVKGNVLYADMFSDLLTIDIADPRNIKLVNSMRGLFPERSYGLGYSQDTDMVVTGWTTYDTVVDVSNTKISVCSNCFYYDALSSYRPESSGGVNVPGMGGSMARFSIVNDYMYTMGTSVLRVLSLTDEKAPKFISSTQIGNALIETIYPFKDKLFIGSTTGMFIYNINDPAHPAMESQTTHFRSCDPVVADDDYAFVTLRGGVTCGGTNNVLDILNVKDVKNPLMVKSYPMTNPHGISKDGQYLFVCDGTDGLKMYDTGDLLNLELLDHIKDIETYDIIAWNNRLIVVSKQGINQYDYADGKKLKFLSTISVKKS
ncbi:MAG: hypothetical protein EOO94_01765 [Pedobacter sp.]|nr:MAG: hypothetical protein EOO94_01765 [Pedobacter sp.]